MSASVASKIRVLPLPVALRRFTALLIESVIESVIVISAVKRHDAMCRSYAELSDRASGINTAILGSKRRQAFRAWQAAHGVGSAAVTGVAR